MASHLVTITVTDDGIEVDKNTVTMKREDKISWTEGSGNDFTISFATETCLKKGMLTASEASGWNEVRSDVPNGGGEYKYTIAAGPHELDPVIVIPPIDRGGNP